MTKLLLLMLIIIIAFWLCKMSAGGKNKQIRKRNLERDNSVIDIKPEDK